MVYCFAHLHFSVGRNSDALNRLKPIIKSPTKPINTGFVRICSLFKLLGGEIYLAVSWYTFVRFILHIHLISYFCVPLLKFLEPKWSQLFNLPSLIKNVLYNCFPFISNIFPFFPIFIDITICFVWFI